MSIELPPVFSGRQSPARIAARSIAYRKFADQLLEVSRGVGFALSGRGWCYVLEEHGLLKSQFDLAEARINTCRKEGFLPLDFTAADDARAPQGHDGTNSDYPVPEELEYLWNDTIQDTLTRYAPVSWCDYQAHYTELGVEKVDLVGLFEPVARESRTLVTNFRGNVDINSKAAMYLRFQQAAERGQQPVLLLAGDHDPKGLWIHQYMRKQFHDLRGLSFADGTTLEWNPDELVIQRFGLNADFIEEQRLSKIDNLITGTGKNLADPRHPDHNKPYVRDYLERYGEWKVEANALVVRVEQGRQLVRDALQPFIDYEGIARYENDVAAAREDLAGTLPDFLRSKLAA